MMSLHGRIALSAGLVLGVFMVATGLALDRAFHESARSARGERLLGQLYLLMGAAEVDSQGNLSVPSTLAEARFSLPGSGLYAQVSDGQGNPVWRSPSALGVGAPFDTGLAPAEKRFAQRADASGKPYFVHSFGVHWVTEGKRLAFTFGVAEDLTEFNRQIAGYRKSLAGWLGGLALLLLAVQGAVLRWGLRPLRQIPRELAAIEAGRQDSLLRSYPRELKGLTDNLNALLRHERAQQKRYRDALADLAHSLKTPLAVLRGILAETPVEKKLAASLEEQIGRMDRIIAYQLQRAATTGASRLAAPIAVRPTAEKIVASLGKVYAGKQVAAEIAIDRETAFRGNEGDLLELLGNLLDNAYKWCSRTVRVSAARQSGALVLTVEDDGPGIEPGKAHHLLQRGVRADETTPGHGIGLAVVRDIVAAYDGQIAVGTGGLGGAAVVLTLPQQ